MNYVLEGNNNFNETLLKALCEKQLSIKKRNEEKICLISQTSLDNNAITLNCNHTFNYLPLFNELIKQKGKANRLEVQKLKKLQIKCPYCRTIHTNVLPYKSELKNAKITGINWPPKYAIHSHRCKALFKSGKRKGQMCNQPCSQPLCNKHKPSSHALSETCSAILKSGMNKGQHCHYKIKKDGRCGLHKI
jgi:hypothetical protein